MTWESFWADVFPAYLGAIGSIAASAVALVALIRDIRTRKGLKEVAQSAAETVESSGDMPTLTRPSGPNRDKPLELVVRGSQTVVRNLTREPIEILDIRVPSGGKAIALRTALPGIVQPGEGFGFIVYDKLGGPAVAALLVEWRDIDGRSRFTRFFV